MKGRPYYRAQPAGEETVMHGNPAPRAPRIQIDVPLGTPYREIQDSILRQAWELAATQLRAAVALGITPETVSRNLRRSKANQDIRTSADRITEDTYPAPGNGIRRGRAVTESADEPLRLRLELEKSPAANQTVSFDPKPGNVVCPTDLCSVTASAAEDHHASPRPGEIGELRADEESAVLGSEDDIGPKSF